MPMMYGFCCVLTFSLASLGLPDAIRVLSPILKALLAFCCNFDGFWPADRPGAVVFRTQGLPGRGLGDKGTE